VILELLRLMRPHQWVKNSFVLTGLIFGHAWHTPALILQTAIIFIAFCLISSTVYILNDIIDIDQDREHPTKRNRPLPSGKLKASSARIFALFLGVTALTLAYFAATIVFVILLIYLVMNIAYSLKLKHVVILDVFIIATGFMLRIFAGTFGIGIPPSQWLLLCGLMVTLFLGFSKRRAEIIVLNDDKSEHRRVLQDYSPLLLDKMIVVTAAGLIMSYSLYTMNPETIRIHGTSNLIYTVPFVVYGVFRYIFLLHNQSSGGDPSRDLVRDPHMLIVMVAWVITTIALIAR